jgi:hypothetical protein
MHKQKPPRSPTKQNSEHAYIANIEKNIRSKTIQNMARNISKGDINQQLELIKQKLAMLVKKTKHDDSESDSDENLIPSIPIPSTQYVRGKSRTFEVSDSNEKLIPSPSTQYVHGKSRTFEVSDYNFKSARKNRQKKKSAKKKSVKKKSVKKKSR